jgi:hypothetical protein
VDVGGVDGEGYQERGECEAVHADEGTLRRPAGAMYSQRLYSQRLYSTTRRRYGEY